MNIFRAIKTKHMMEESILLEIDSLSENIQRSVNEEKNACNAKSIKTLAEAYDIIHRGKKFNDF